MTLLSIITLTKHGDAHLSPSALQGAGAPGFASGEAWFHSDYSAADRISEMLERFHDWLTLDNLRLIERYVEAEIVLCVHLSAGEQYVAYFQRAHAVGGTEKGIHDWYVGALEGDRLSRRFARDESFTHHSAHRGSQVDASERTSGSQYDAMLVNVVQAVEGPKLVPIPSFVSLYPKKRIESILSEKTFLFHSAQNGFVLTGGIPDRELALPICVGDAHANQHQLLRQVIKCAPEVLNRVTSDCHDGRRDTCNVGYLINMLRLYLFNDAIGFGRQEGLDFPVKIDDVLFGPFNFDINDAKPFVDRHGKIR